jgi:hypothetical protein
MFIYSLYDPSIPIRRQTQTLFHAALHLLFFFFGVATIVN